MDMLVIDSVVGPDGQLQEPGNLGTGWVGLDFGAAFGRITTGRPNFAQPHRDVHEWESPETFFDGDIAV